MPRHPIGDRPMTATERSALRRQRDREAREQNEWLLAENEKLRAELAEIRQNPAREER